jgi:hypothetical protein
MAPTPDQIQLIRDYEPALFFLGTPGGAGAERFFPSDAKRYLEHASLWRAKTPFATRADWGTPVVDAGKLGARAGEADVFLGERDASGVPLYRHRTRNAFSTYRVGNRAINTPILTPLLRATLPSRI